MHLYKRTSSGKSWQGWLDSNQRMRESKSLALPLGDTPVWKGMRDRDTPDPSFLFVGWVKGLEPSTPGTTIRCSNQLSYTHHISCTRELATYSKKVARQKGLEPLAHCLEGSCSIQLSYWRIGKEVGAGDGNRTRIPSLEGWCPGHCATPASALRRNRQLGYHTILEKLCQYKF